MATSKAQLIEVRQTLFNRIFKLSKYVDEVEKRIQLDQEILEDPIIDM